MDWPLVESLFEEASQLPGDRRSAFLEGACGDPNLRRTVLRMLAEADGEPSNFLQELIERVAAELAGFAASTDLTGHCIGPYRIDREIGRGGMGSVYLATRQDETYERNVAIKFLRPEFDNRAFRERFQRERRILGRLDHPYIAKLIDAGSTEAGQPYFVMEFVADAKLISEHVRAARLSKRATAALFAKVCEAVQYAHQNLTVHRDLKPANILIDANGTPRLLDFGIAKLVGSDGSATDHTVAAGLRLMTPDYASPEHAAGQAVTTATDIYSLGAVLYELLANARPPRLGEGQSEIDPPAAFGADLGGVLRKAMHRDPALRYATVNDLRDDLLRYVDGRQIRARSYSWHEHAAHFARQHRGIIAACLLIAASLTVATVVSLRWAARADAARREAETARQEAVRHAAEAGKQRESAEAERNVARARFADSFQLSGQMIHDLQDKIGGLPGAGPARLASINVARRYLERMSKDPEAGPEVWHDLAFCYYRLAVLLGGVTTSVEADQEEALGYLAKADAILNRPELANRRATFELRAWVRNKRVASLRLMNDTEGWKSAAAEGVKAGREYLRLSTGTGVMHPQTPLAGVLQAAGVAALDSSMNDEALGYAAECRRVLANAKLDQLGKDLLAGCLSVEGRVRARKGQLDSGIAVLRESIRLREDLLKETPSNLAARRLLMLSYSHLAAFLGNPAFANKGNLSGSMDAMKQANDHAEYLAASDPWDPNAQRDLAISSSRLADLTLGARKYEDAARQFAGAHAQLQNVRRLMPDLASLLQEMGHAARKESEAWSMVGGHEEESLSAYRKALAAAQAIEALKAPVPNALLLAMEIHQRVPPSKGTDPVWHVTHAMELLDRALKEHPAVEVLQVRRFALRTAAANRLEELGKPGDAHRLRELVMAEWRASTPATQAKWPERERLAVEAKLAGGRP